jgi:hypothetical protein
MATANTITTNEAEIRQLIADQQRAICTKDINQIMSRYAIESGSGRLLAKTVCGWG